MYWIETVVCSGHIGKEARLFRMLELRQEFKRRKDGCISAWVGRNNEDKTLFLVHSVFASQKAWRMISSEVIEQVDPKDGGIESLLSGPPLVGVFEVDESKFHSKSSE